MTIIAGFSASRQGPAPLNLAMQIARWTGDAIVAAAIVERPWPAKDDPIEREYLGYVTEQASLALDRVVSQLPGDVDVPTVVHQSQSVPTGLMELVAAHDASHVVVGSSSSGLLGRVALGSVTERLVHTAAVPVAIAPRGYPMIAEPIRRLTVAYGGEADVNGLVAATAEMARKWPVTLRIVSFTVRPMTMYGGAIERSTEDLVVQQWARRTRDDISKQLSLVRAQIPVPDVDLVVGSGHDWREAVESVSWEAGDMLTLGSGAAGPAAHVFLGSAASKILRHAPVPVMIVPRNAAAA
ncbi:MULTISPECIES: universal stress protein [unclassified Rhodococcus (in: high G+C Gram-positive bacteria)]|uniref:universal stress protein n=1 Tax=unclassified Rhodococcus (in: high G+C Gram-positive bacteria) TaxID=192944 RepID=UPI00163B4BEA|nr:MULTISPECIES: universal stress protein [unclassified Rhodococcus (in: high G+C Gram-positive bacteria)]MBC2638084.1 universal stress protein [Rhodococcus sp. 3A]MBC2897169.1 universal stress protein [Rhodococcus sp. 4CII]